MTEVIMAVMIIVIMFAIMIIIIVAMTLVIELLPPWPRLSRTPE